jgi:tyrosyl-tRNA synthetase
MNLVEELKWRGMLQEITPGLEEQLAKEMTSGYVGFDPTADSLHIGSLVPILLLLHLQRAGHKPIALVGGATGMVGDPSGKSEERNLLDEETLRRNITGIRGQLEKYLDFTSAIPNRAELVNNYDWFKGLGFIEFLRDVGKHITVNYMISKESVRKRIEGETGISYTEFAYQLMQGYDFYWLYTNKNCKLQMGGSDQWGNITTGTELIRRKAGGDAYALTCPLVTKADGGKFGKTEKGNVWLDPTRTSPYQFYQFWLNAADDDAEKWIRLFTLLDRESIESTVETHRREPGTRHLQKTLAREVTAFVHGEAELEAALRTTESLFKSDASGMDGLSIDNLLGALEGVPTHPMRKADIEAGMDVTSFLALSGIFPSKGEARRTIQGGGLSINRVKVGDASAPIGGEHLLDGRYILVQKGKKNYYLVVAE